MNILYSPKHQAELAFNVAIFGRIILIQRQYRSCLPDNDKNVRIIEIHLKSLQFPVKNWDNVSLCVFMA